MMKAFKNFINTADTSIKKEIVKRRLSEKKERKNSFTNKKLKIGSFKINSPIGENRLKKLGSFNPKSIFKDEATGNLSLNFSNVRHRKSVINRPTQVNKIMQELNELNTINEI